ASSSAVEIPGATARRIASSAAATTRPAARIFPICSGVLYWMSRSRRRRYIICPRYGLTAVRAERVDRANGDVLHRAGGVVADQLALRPVVVHQGRGVAGVDPQPLGDGLRLVVVALEQRPAAAV